MRPLLYHDDGRRVVVASTMAGILAAGVPFAPDEGVVAEVLAGGPFSRRETAVRGVRRVLPGTLLTFGPEGTREETVRSIAPVPGGADLEAFREALRAALADRLPATGPAALLLSGGLDSGTLALLAAGRDLRAFTVSFPGLPCDEAERARATAAAAGLRHEVIPWEPPAPGPFDGEIPPFPTLHGAAARIRAAGIPVVLDGEGGDEILAPSPWAAADRLAAGRPSGGFRENVEFGLRALLPSPLRRAARLLRPGDPLPRWIDAGFARRTELRDRLRVEPPVRGPAGFARSGLAAEFTSGYALACRDAAARWDGLRHPLLDLRVIETALALPDSLRWTEAEDRVALRRAQDRLPLRAGKAEFTPVLLRTLRAEGFLDRPRAPLLEEAGWIDPAGLASAARDVEGRTARGEPGAFADSMGAWTVFAVEAWLRGGSIPRP